jgi:hypothetical protein
MTLIDPYKFFNSSQNLNRLEDRGRLLVDLDKLEGFIAFEK